MNLVGHCDNNNTQEKQTIVRNENNFSFYDEMMLYNFHISSNIDLLFDNTSCLGLKNGHGVFQEEKVKRNLYATRSFRDKHELKYFSKKIKKKITKEYRKRV